jgi:hypothetical protein
VRAASLLSFSLARRGQDKDEGDVKGQGEMKMIVGISGRCNNLIRRRKMWYCTLEHRENTQLTMEKTVGLSDIVGPILSLWA